jgi:hydrogenase expression/formation protein HypC
MFPVADRERLASFPALFDPMCLAVPGKILEIQGDDPLFRAARVSFGGIVKQVSLACVPEAKVDDYVLVHVGMALSIVDEKEAAEVFSYLQQMGELAELDPPGVAAAAASLNKL